MPRAPIAIELVTPRLAGDSRVASPQDKQLPQPARRAFRRAPRAAVRAAASVAPRVAAVAPGTEATEHGTEATEHGTEATEHGLPAASTAPAASPARASTPARSPTPTESLQLPAAIESPTPSYPLSARRRRAEGLVVVRARVGHMGRVIEAQVAQSSGASDLDRSAIEAVKLWKFRPGTRGSRAVDAWVNVPVRFRINPARL